MTLKGPAVHYVPTKDGLWHWPALGTWTQMSGTICTLKACCVVWCHTTRGDCDGIIDKSLCLAVVASLCTCCVDNHLWLLWQQSKPICIVSAAHQYPLLVWSLAGLNITQTHWKNMPEMTFLLNDIMSLLGHFHDTVRVYSSEVKCLVFANAFKNNVASTIKFTLNLVYNVKGP